MNDVDKAMARLLLAEKFWQLVCASDDNNDVPGEVEDAIREWRSVAIAELATADSIDDSVDRTMHPEAYEEGSRYPHRRRRSGDPA